MLFIQYLLHSVILIQSLFSKDGGVAGRPAIVKEPLEKLFWVKLIPSDRNLEANESIFWSMVHHYCKKTSGFAPDNPTEKQTLPNPDQYRYLLLPFGSFLY